MLIIHLLGGIVVLIMIVQLQFQMHADAWGCPVMPPIVGSCPQFPQVSVLVWIIELLEY